MNLLVYVVVNIFLEKTKIENFVVKLVLIDMEYIEKIYACAWNRELKKRIQLHRLVTNCPENFVVDHINHNPLDNRKLNLRVCTQYENMQNQSKKKSKK